MSWLPSTDPLLGDKQSCDALELVIVPRARDLGGFEVRRALPHAKVELWRGMGHHPMKERFDDLVALVREVAAPLVSAGTLMCVDAPVAGGGPLEQAA